MLLLIKNNYLIYNPKLKKMLKKIIIIILILLSINTSFAWNNENIIKLKQKILETKHKNILSKIDLLIQKTKIKKLNLFWKKIKEYLEKSWKSIKKENIYLLLYIYYQIKEKNIKIEKYNWKDISNILKQKHLQKMPLSCEISATSDILSYLKKKEIKESEILNKLEKSKYNELPNKNKKWERIWWNPQEGFVWYMNKLPNWRKATQGYMTWYGVLENPINNIYKNYWFKTKILKNWNISDILEELEKWNMIQLWWDICTNPKFYNWKEVICRKKWKLTWDKDRKLIWKYLNKKWKYINYSWLNWEHAFYLLWYKWSYLKPSHIIIWDTMTWKHIYPTSEWMRKWWKMQYRSIIIYKNRL